MQDSANMRRLNPNRGVFFLSRSLNVTVLPRGRETSVADSFYFSSLSCEFLPGLISLLGMERKGDRSMQEDFLIPAFPDSFKFPRDWNCGRIWPLSLSVPRSQRTFSSCYRDEKGEKESYGSIFPSLCPRWERKERSSFFLRLPGVIYVPIILRLSYKEEARGEKRHCITSFVRTGTAQRSTKARGQWRRVYSSPHSSGPEYQRPRRVVFFLLVIEALERIHISGY